jgi:hypothetical protein
MLGDRTNTKVRKKMVLFAPLRGYAYNTVGRRKNVSPESSESVESLYFYCKGNDNFDSAKGK